MSHAAVRLRPLHQVAPFDVGSDSDEGNEVGCIHGSRAGLGGLDELEHHRKCGLS